MNNKGTDQTVQMLSVVCAFVVCIQQKSGLAPEPIFVLIKVISCGYYLEKSQWDTSRLYRNKCFQKGNKNMTHQTRILVLMARAGSKISTSLINIKIQDGINKVPSNTIDILTGLPNVKKL